VNTQAGQNFFLGYVYCLSVPFSSSKGRVEPKHSTVKVAGSLPRDQSSSMTYFLYVQLKICLHEQLFKSSSAVLHADAK